MARIIFLVDSVVRFDFEVYYLISILSVLRGYQQCQIIKLALLTLAALVAVMIGYFLKEVDLRMEK